VGILFPHATPAQGEKRSLNNWTAAAWYDQVRGLQSANDGTTTFVGAGRTSLPRVSSVRNCFEQVRWSPAILSSDGKNLALDARHDAPPS
jgi:hypothetical protein